MVETKKCVVCGKIVEGLSKKDLEYKYFLHQIKHRTKKEEEEVENVEGYN